MSYLIELAVHCKLLSGIIINFIYVTPKAGQVSVILVNTANRNILTQQTLFATEAFEVEVYPWHYIPIFTGRKIQ